MPYNLLLLPLLGGFIFIWKWNITRYHAARSQNERLLLFSALAGLFFLTLSLLIIVSVRQKWPGLAVWWHSYLPFPYSGTAFLAFLFGAFLWMPLNWLSSSQKQLHKILDEDGDRFELILKRAMTEKKMISLTLKNNKTYFGFVTAPLNPALKMRSISILPFRSGYRDEVTKILHFTTEYWQVYEAFNLEIDQKENELKQKREEQTALRQLEAEKRKELAQAEQEMAQIEQNLNVPLEPVAPAEKGSQNGTGSKEEIVKKLKEEIQLKQQSRSIVDSQIKKLDEEVKVKKSRLSDYETIVPIEEVCILSIYHHDLYKQYFAPKIDGLEPMTGVIGSIIKIKGVNFGTATEVKFNGVNARSFVVNSPAEIEAVVPQNAMSGPICVKTPGGETTSPVSFSFIPPPIISGVAPESRSVNAEVRIIGSNLTDATEITFNGAIAAIFSIDSSTQITVTIPTSATSGPITVKTPGGSNISPRPFTVTA
jgi:hypothetical protein